MVPRHRRSTTSDAGIFRARRTAETAANRSRAARACRVVPRDPVGHHDEHHRPAVADWCRPGRSRRSGCRSWPAPDRRPRAGAPARNAVARVPLKPGHRQAGRAAAARPGAAPSAASASRRGQRCGGTAEPRARPLPSSSVAAVGRHAELGQRLGARPPSPPAKVAGRSRADRGQPQQGLGQVVVAGLQRQLDQLGDGRRLDRAPARRRPAGALAPGDVRRTVDPRLREQPGQLPAARPAPGRPRGATRAGPHPAGVDRQRADRRDDPDRHVGRPASPASTAGPVNSASSTQDGHRGRRRRRQRRGDLARRGRRGWRAPR